MRLDGRVCAAYLNAKSIYYFMGKKYASGHIIIAIGKIYRTKRFQTKLHIGFNLLCNFIFIIEKSR